MDELQRRPMVGQRRSRNRFQFDHVKIPGKFRLKFFVPQNFRHENLNNADMERWKTDMVGMRNLLAKFGQIDPLDVIGMRAPQLALGSDTMFKVGSSFQCDSDLHNWPD